MKKLTPKQQVTLGHNRIVAAAFIVLASGH